MTDRYTHPVLRNLAPGSRLVAAWRFDARRAAWTLRPATSILPAKDGVATALRLQGGSVARDADRLPESALCAPNASGKRPWEVWRGGKWVADRKAMLAGHATLRRSRQGRPVAEFSYLLNPARQACSPCRDTPRDARTGCELGEGSLLLATWELDAKSKSWAGKSLVLVPAGDTVPRFEPRTTCTHPVTGDSYQNGEIACLDTPSGPFYFICQNGAWQPLNEPCDLVAWVEPE